MLNINSRRVEYSVNDTLVAYMTKGRHYATIVWRGKDNLSVSIDSRLADKTFTTICAVIKFYDEYADQYVPLVFELIRSIRRSVGPVLDDEKICEFHRTLDIYVN